MEPLRAVLYVFSAIAAFVLLSWLMGRLRSRRDRPGRGGPDPRLLEARKRYEAGEITEAELRRIEERIRRR